MTQLIKTDFLKNKFFKRGLLSIIGSFLVRAVNLISIPIFTRIMNIDEYGQANIFMTYASIFTIILSLDFRGALSKGCIEFEEDDKGFMSSCLFFTSIFSLFIIVITNCYRDFFRAFFYLTSFELNILIIYSYVSFVIMYASENYIFHFKYKENTFLSIGVALGNLFCSIFFILTFFHSNRYLGRIFGAFIPTLLIAMGIYIYVLYIGKKIFIWKYIRFSMEMGIPLIPHNLSHFILGNADKIMINNMINSSVSGIYSVIYNVGLMLSVLVEALNNVWIPWLFRKINENKFKDILRNSKLYLIFFSFFTILIEGISPEIVKIISPKEYWEGINIVIWIVFSTYLIFVYTLYVNVEFYYKKTYLISLGTFMAATMNIILNILFLPKYGYFFAAYSTVMSYVALLFFHMFIVSFILKRKIISNIFVFKVLIMMSIYSIVLYFLRDFFIFRIIFMVFYDSIFVLYFFVINKNQIED